MNILDSAEGHVQTVLFQIVFLEVYPACESSKRWEFI